MYAILKNLVSHEECQILAEIANKYKKDKKLGYEGNMDAYKNSYGTARIPEYENLLNRLTPIISKKSGYDDITPENSYTRIYYNGATLKKHIDRINLDLTLSLCTFTNLSKPWPLFVETLDKNIISIDLNVGDAGLILGRKMYHWRNDLVCDENEYVIQSFFHWKINYSKNKIKFL